MNILYIIFLLGVLFPNTSCEEIKCAIQEKFALNGLFKRGDIMLGGTFIKNFKTIPPDLSFTSKPNFELSVFQRAQTMIFAIEEINRDESFLPNISLGYRLYDNCNSLPMGLRATVSLISSLSDTFTENNCNEVPPVLAIVGDPISSHSIASSRILSLFRVPMVSYFSTCSCLSNRKEFPTFFRTIPNDDFQVKAMVEIIKYYKWTWVGAVGTDDDYGQNALKALHEQVKMFGCISFSETIPRFNDKSKVEQIITIIKQSSAKVIVAFASEAELLTLVKEVVRQNITGRQWIASESWSTSSLLATKENFRSFGGTIGIAIRRVQIPGLENFFFQVQPKFDPNNNLLIQFWETLFECRFPENVTQNNSSLVVSKVCTGLEDIKSTKSGYTDTSDMRAVYNVYKAVYAIAHALHDLMSCKEGSGPFTNRHCADIKNLQPWQLSFLKHFTLINFTNKLGEKITFDENGDPPAVYDIVNWQLDADGSVKIKNIGLFDESAGVGKELDLNKESIFWNPTFGSIPESVCSNSCLPGTRKATRKGEPVCCFDCISCAEGEISSETDSIECIKCPSDFWSNSPRNQCILKDIEFLSYEDVMGIALSTTALSGSALSFIIFIVFFHYRNTPVVKANNSELSFLLLVSLALCFLCSLCFIGKPTSLNCMLRHVVFGISFVLAISCILVKTIVVIMAFKATLPGNNMMKWFGVAQQRTTVFLFTVIQAIICLIWLSLSPPVPNKNSKYQNGKIIFECDIGSTAGFTCLLGYIGFLACVCFAIAFLARNLPDTFNEAKFITFSMLIFCTVWITFIPAYISSPGKHTVAVEVFAILASSFGLLFAIFAPKCIVILFKPELNTKKALMGKGTNRKSKNGNFFSVPSDLCRDEKSWRVGVSWESFHLIK
uniref:Extracellular calcium-sensing receptor-like n=1 Tax=Erpetoichthys calabaricus TaxID=27687 RepID=A0A8C4TFF6_ERPCA